MQITTEITDAYGENRKKNFNCSGESSSSCCRAGNSVCRVGDDSDQIEDYLQRPVAREQSLTK